MDKFISYLRVSTVRQGKSQLGIEAQRKAVADYTKNCSNCILAEFEEHESGGKDNRPQLLKALKMCEKTGATLVVAKLDRLSRNAAFILTLLEKSKGKDGKAKFKIVFCDNPEIDETMLGMLAIFAQHERKTMSLRQKAQYESKRARGVKLGYAEALTDEVRQMGAEAKRTYRANNESLINAKDQMKLKIKEAISENKTLIANDLVNHLNSLSIKTIRNYDYELNNIRPIIKEVLNEMSLQALPTATPPPTVKKEKNDTTVAKTVSTNMRANKKTFQQIADFLNENGFKTAKGKVFEAITVKRLIEKQV